jgi:DNA processing protein
VAARSKYIPPSAVVALGPSEAFDDVRVEEMLRLPPLLYTAGDAGLLRAAMRVAVVGSRGASEEGRRRAAKLGRQLAQAGAVTVSGLAEGIDVEAHLGAISAGGRTIAVIGTPLDKAYPAAHAELQMQIYRDHLLVSQFTAETRVFPSNFLARNKVMARIAHASVIVEAGETSGSLSQAREVLALGRPLFLMRSLLENSQIQWPQAFVKSGARVLDRTEQLLEAIL